MDSWRGFRFARFSGENKNELSESFFFGAVPKRNEFPTMEEQCCGIPKGQSARWSKESGLG